MEQNCATESRDVPASSSVERPSAIDRSETGCAHENEKQQENPGHCSDSPGCEQQVQIERVHESKQQAAPRLFQQI